VDPLQQLVHDFLAGLGLELQHFSTWVTDGIDTGADNLLRLFLLWLTQLSFITHTPYELVNALANVVGPREAEDLMRALAGTTILFAGFSYILHRWLAFPAPGEFLQKLGLVVILVHSSVQMTDWTLQVFDTATQHVSASLPSMPLFQAQQTNPFVTIVLLAVWVILLFRLALTAAKRIAWLALLKPLAPYAFITLLIPKASWLAGLWAKLWFGFLVGQIFLILGIVLATIFVSIGGFGGYVLSAAALLVAADSVNAIAPVGESHLFSFGPFKI
jgi:hypothetical protein